MDDYALIGWISSLILLFTLGAQIRKEMRSRSVAGVSPWLFTGQVSAQIGFVTYSWLVGNVVFIVTNCALLALSLVGLYVTNVRRRAG